MDLTTLNAVAKVDQLELKKLNSVTVNGVYPIKNMRLLKTKKYGEKVIIHTADNQYFLPSHVSQHLLCDRQKFNPQYTQGVWCTPGNFKKQFTSTKLSIWSPS